MLGGKWRLVVKGWKEGGWGGWGDEEDGGRRRWRSGGSRSLLIKGERLPAEVVGAVEVKGGGRREEGCREQSE